MQGHGEDCEVNLRSMGYNVDQRMAVLGPQLHEGVPLVHAASGAGVPLRTAQRWLAAYLTGGAAGLRRAHPGTSSSRRRAALALG